MCKGERGNPGQHRSSGINQQYVFEYVLSDHFLKLFPAYCGCFSYDEIYKRLQAFN